jgi:hypothetical protein
VTTAALAEADTLIVFDYQFYQASEADRQLIADWAAAGGSMFIETESFSNALNPVLSALNLAFQLDHHEYRRASGDPEYRAP